MRLLDLFCCAGGAAVGYHRAGFTEIVGVDIVHQPRYPFAFIRADALEYVAEHGHEFDAIHASPPCQHYSALQRVTGKEYPDLVAVTRQSLHATGKPYVIENVVGAPLDNPAMLCGAMFGLKVYRHRLFETNPFILMPRHVPHKDQTPSAGRGLSPKGFICVTGDGGLKGIGFTKYARQAMGIDWMNRQELSQAIPPAYTEWIGRHLVEHIMAGAEDGEVFG